MIVINYRNLSCLHQLKSIPLENDVIKFISNNVIVTKDNYIYIVKGTLKQAFQKLNDTASSIGLIKYIACRESNYAVVLNNNYELFLIGNYYSSLMSVTQKNIITYDHQFEKILNLSNYANEFLSLRCGQHQIFLVTKSAIYTITKKSIQFKLTKIYSSNEVNIIDFQCSIDQQYPIKLLLNAEGEVFATGIDDSKTNTFEQIELPFKVKKIFHYTNHFFLLNEDGELYKSGHLSYSPRKFKFIKIELTEKVKFVFGTIYINVICTENNNVYISGYNYAHNLEYKLLKLNIKESYIYPTIFGNEIIFITSRNKINYFEEHDEKENVLGLNCFLKFINNNLNDIEIKIN
ncbi:hypothetical protein ABK040_003594 [Willaertia magna]